MCFKHSVVYHSCFSLLLGDLKTLRLSVCTVYAFQIVCCASSICFRSSCAVLLLLFEFCVVYHLCVSRMHVACHLFFQMPMLVCTFCDYYCVYHRSIMHLSSMYHLCIRYVSSMSHLCIIYVTSMYRLYII